MLTRSSFGLLVAVLVGAVGCSGSRLADATDSGPAQVAPLTGTAIRRVVTLEDRPVTCTVSLAFDNGARTVTADVVLTVVAPDGIRSATYEFEPLVRDLEAEATLPLGAGQSQEDAILMYTARPDPAASWNDVMLDRARLALVREAGTAEQHLDGW